MFVFHVVHPEYADVKVNGHRPSRWNYIGASRLVTAKL